MASLGDIIKLGKEIGLEGEDLRNFALTREQELKEKSSMNAMNEQEKEKDKRKKLGKKWKCKI